MSTLVEILEVGYRNMVPSKTVQDGVRSPTQVHILN